MKIPFFLIVEQDEKTTESFKEKIFFDNIKRGRLFAIVVIILEIILFIINVSSWALKVDDRFQFESYLIMYSIMIIFNVLYLIFTQKYTNKKTVPSTQIKKREMFFLAYITLVMTWGSVVSLMDQMLYGQIVVFMLNMITCSVICLLDNKKVLISYVISSLVLLIGLPFFQTSSDILIGHYVNLCIFVFISWLASRMIYYSYYNDFVSKTHLRELNMVLERKIEENTEINKELKEVNRRLEELALVDDLTGIPNRRSLRNFINKIIESNDIEFSTLSIILFDIDFFKQFNDYYGHEEGDKALIAVAKQINSMVKNRKEFFCRLGGEEFIYAIVNQKQEYILSLADEIREKITEMKIPHEYSDVNCYITVSAGVSTINLSSKEDVGQGISLADRALYLAKNDGRNCVKSLCHEYK